MELKLIDIFSVLLIMLVLIEFAYEPCYDRNTSVINFKAYKGLFAILIFFHHISQRVSAGYFSIYQYVGSLIVGGFLLLSGYGVMNSYLLKGRESLKDILLIKLYFYFFLGWYVFC